MSQFYLSVYIILKKKILSTEKNKKKKTVTTFFTPEINFTDRVAKLRQNQPNCYSKLAQSHFPHSFLSVGAPICRNSIPDWVVKGLLNWETKKINPRQQCKVAQFHGKTANFELYSTIQ